jgi:putative SOS response-associated peptidase YedK
MCGRARCSLAPHDLRAAAAAAAGLPQDAPWVGEQQYRPSYNAAPGGWLPVMRVDEQGQPMLHTMK